MAPTITAVPAPEPTNVVLSWAADAPARTEFPDATQPTLDALTEGQIAAECGLNAITRGLEELESLCRTLGANVNAPAVDLATGLRVVAARIATIRFDLGEEDEAIVPLANLAAWYHRAVAAQTAPALDTRPAAAALTIATPLSRRRTLRGPQGGHVGE
jgi:hypothetical protein